MSKVRVHISASLDGYVAGPNQSMEEPLGVGGEGLHDWLVALKEWREASGMDGGEENDRHYHGSWKRDSDWTAARRDSLERSTTRLRITSYNPEGA